MSAGDQEIFGPVVSIKRVRDFDEGLQIMNANPFANGSSIFTQDGHHAREFELRTDGGMVGINVGIPVPSAYYPFSGNKESFLGDQHVLGLNGYRFYTRAKTVTKHWFNASSRTKTLDSWEGTVRANLSADPSRDSLRTRVESGDIGVCLGIRLCRGFPGSNGLRAAGAGVGQAERKRRFVAESVGSEERGGPMCGRCGPESAARPALERQERRGRATACDQAKASGRLVTNNR